MNYVFDPKGKFIVMLMDTVRQTLANEQKARILWIPLHEDFLYKLERAYFDRNLQPLPEDELQSVLFNLQNYCLITQEKRQNILNEYKETKIRRENVGFAWASERILDLSREDFIYYFQASS